MIPMGKVESFFRYCFVIFSILVVGIKCMYLFNILPTMFAAAGAAGILLLCILAFLFWQRLYDGIANRMKGIERLSYGKMLIIIAAISLITKLLAIAVFHVESLNDGSDIDVYVGAAYELGTTGIATSHAGYLTSFSHMFWFGAFLSPIAGAFGISQTAFSIYLTIVLTISSLLLFAAFAEQVGKNKAFVVFVIFNILPGTILLPQYITHEIALLFFESIAIWIYFRCLPKCKNSVGRIILYLLFVMALLVASLMNTAGLVMCIAFAILFFVQFLKKFGARTFGLFAAKILVLIFVIIIGSTIAAGVQRNHCDVPEDYILSDKVLWTMYVGGSVAHDGEWNSDDSKEFNSYDNDLSYDEIQQFRKDKVIERYRELFNNPSDLGHLIKQKLITVWGVFGYSILYTNENIPDPHLQEIYNSLLDRPLLLLEYVATLLASIICLVEVIRHRKKASDYALLIQLYLMGTTAMLMLTECRNKYAIAIQPFFWMACFVLSRKKESEVVKIES